MAVAVCLLALFPSRAKCFQRLRQGETLTLRRAIALTLENHPRGLEMRQEASAAQARTGEAQSRLLPQVFGAAEYMRATDNPIGNVTYMNPGFIPRITGTLHGGPPIPNQSFSSINSFLGGVGVDQYLFDFGRVRGQIQERAQQARAAQEESEYTDLQLVFEATQRYFALLAARRKVKVYEKAVAQRNEQLHDAQVKYAAGLRSDIDVLTAKSVLERARTSLVQARNTQAVARVALDNAMGFGHDAPSYKVVDVLSYQPVSASVDSYFTTALELRPDLKMLKAEVKAAGAQIRIARSDYFPTGNAVAGYTGMGTGLPAANNYDVGIVITWPIFNGFLTTREVDEAKAQRNAMGYAMRDLELRIWLQVKSAYLQLQTAVQQIKQARAALQASQSELDLAQKRYEIGLGNIIELTIAERFYIQNDAAYVDALYGYAVAKASLRSATATSLPSEHQH